MRAAAASSSGGGIQFDTDPQSGDWLHVTATGDDGSGRGIFLETTTAELNLTGSSIRLAATNTSIVMSAADFLFLGTFSGSDDFSVNVGGNLSLSGAGGVGGFSVAAGGLVSITGNTQAVELYGTNDIVIRGFTPTSFPALQQILRVTQDPTGTNPPTYHIYSGAAWVADL